MSPPLLPPLLLGWRRTVAKLQSDPVAPAPGAPTTIPQGNNMPATKAPYSITVIPDRHLNHVKGFRAQGVWAQIKKKSRDVSLIVSDRPSKGAAVFTQNAFCAAPVTVSRSNTGVPARRYRLYDDDDWTVRFDVVRTVPPASASTP